MRLSDKAASGPVAPTVPVSWSDRVDAVFGGDVAAVLGVVTPSGGVLLLGVAPSGLRDREHATVTFTSSLGYWRKLDRMARHPEVALLYADRSHGLATDPLAALVQGRATIESEPDAEFLPWLLDEQMPRFFGPRPRGRLWDRLTYEYQWVRVRVTVAVHRVTAWDPGTGRLVETSGSPWPIAGPAPQSPPAAGTAPRVRVSRAARRATSLRRTYLGHVGADGHPVVTDVAVTGASPDGLDLMPRRPLPSGGRRAALYSHQFGSHLVGLAEQHHSGWLDVTGARVRFAPFTSRGFTAPFGVRFATTVGSIQAKRGLRAARRAGLVVDGRWVGPPVDRESADHPRRGM